jgi:protein O-mannosyl-transferase
MFSHPNENLNAPSKRGKYLMARKKQRQAKTPIPAPLSPAPRQPRTWTKHLLAAVALCALTLLAYSNSFHGGFVMDSRTLILADSRVHEVTSDNIQAIFDHTYWWPTAEARLYRPVTTLSYLFNYSVLGNADHPEGYHWINFFLHFLNVLLVYALALRLLQKFWLTIFIAAVWAVHPILTESVTNIVGRADLLAAAAVLSGFLLYLKSVESSGWRRYASLVGLLVVTAIGMYSKESAVSILGVLIVYEFTFWKNRRNHVAHIQGIALGCAAIALPLGVMLYQRAKVLAASRLATFPFPDNPLMGAHFLRARLTALVVTAKYLWLLVWPARLSADYSYSQIPLATGTVHEWIAWIVVTAFVAAVIGQFTRNRSYFFFGAFAFIAFLPVANLLFLIGTIMAERFLYLPSVGFAAFTVMLVYAIGEKAKVRALAPVFLCLIIAGFAARTWTRNIDWQSDLSMGKASVISSPNSFKTHTSLAIQLSNADPSGSNVYEATTEIDRAVAILDPLPNSLSTASTYAEAGRIYQDKGDRLVRIGADGKPIVPPESVRAYDKALQLLLRGEAIDQAVVADYKNELRASGRNADVPLGMPKLYEQLSRAYMRLGKYPEAYEAAVHDSQLEPATVQNYIVMGQALAVQGRLPDATRAFVEGLLASGNQTLVLTLRELYKTGLDPQGCAITQTPDGPSLNSSCAPVHRDLCRASADLSTLYRQELRGDQADVIKSRAMEQFGCTAAEVK